MSKALNARRQRNGKIEFLRFLFAVIIVIHHSRNLLGDDQCMFLGGSLAVEFFFIVSGYLMMASIEKIQRQGPANGEPLGKETIRFLGKKVSAVSPEVFVAWVIGFVFVVVAKSQSIKEAAKLFIGGIWEMLLLSMSGISVTGVNGVVWYISSMLLCMAILYPLIRRYPDMARCVIIPLCTLLLFGFLCQNYGEPRNPTKWLHLAYKGTLRGFAEIGLGVMCFSATTYIRKLPLNSKGKFLVTVVEIFSYTAAIWYMYTQKATERDYFFIMLLAIGAILSFSGQGIFAASFNNVFCIFLGKFSSPLYFSHVFYAQYLNNLLPESFQNNQRMAVYMASAFGTAVGVMLMSDWIRKNYRGWGKIVRAQLLTE